MKPIILPHNPAIQMCEKVLRLVNDARAFATGISISSHGVLQGPTHLQVASWGIRVVNVHSVDMVMDRCISKKEPSQTSQHAPSKQHITVKNAKHWRCNDYLVTKK
jgi:hypothetical protein